jgi:hypothetical protein
MRDDSALEAALRRVMEPQQARKAAERIARRLESHPLPAQEPARAWWPSTLALAFAPAWPRIAALACAAVLGMSIGFSSFGARIVANLDLVRVAAAEDSASNVLDPDTGMRP